MYGCQQVLINPRNELKAVLEFICQQANSLTNCGIYYARQLYFKAQKLIGKYTLEAEYKDHRHYKALYSQTAQQVLRTVYESFQSYRKLKEAFYQGLIADKPHPPKYRKSGGMALVTYPKQALKLLDKQIRIPLGKQIKCWFGIDSFSIAMPSNLNFADIKELRILPRNGCFYAEFVYKLEKVGVELDKGKVLGVDPGLNNWLTCVSNIGKSFILDGRKIKSQNQWYNKRVAKLKIGKPQGFWSDELASITEKRNRQMRDSINKAARFVINWCAANSIGTLVFGWHQGNKDSIELGKKNNQEFVQIPTARLKARLAGLCEQYGIQFVETEESYTSLDDDFLPIYGEKPDGWKASGKRGVKKKGVVHNLGRGGYETRDGIRINSDCNGAANILKKVATQLGISLVEVGRAVLALPQRYDLFQGLSKSYRERCQ